MSLERWFFRTDDEWIAIAERLQHTLCLHCKALGTLAHPDATPLAEGMRPDRLLNVAQSEKAVLSKGLLRRLRNDLPLPVTIALLDREAPPATVSEGYCRFVCPGCGAMRATVNPRNNLAHCFGCKKNLNNIDLLMTLS